MLGRPTVSLLELEDLESSGGLVIGPSPFGDLRKSISNEAGHSFRVPDVEGAKSFADEAFPEAAVVILKRDKFRATKRQ